MFIAHTANVWGQSADKLRLFCVDFIQLLHDSEMLAFPWKLTYYVRPFMNFRSRESLDRYQYLLQTPKMVCQSKSFRQLWLHAIKVTKLEACRFYIVSTTFSCTYMVLFFHCLSFKSDFILIKAVQMCNRVFWIFSLMAPRDKTKFVTTFWKTLISLCLQLVKRLRTIR